MFHKHAGLQYDPTEWSQIPPCGGQSSMGLPVKIASCFGVLEFMKSQTPSTKLQTNLKFQYQMTETGLEF